MEAVQGSGTEEASQTQQGTLEDSDAKLPEQADSAYSLDESATGEESTAVEERAGNISTEENVIVVHVCGAVDKPGVYTLAAECRVWDAIDAAGGFSEDAATDYLNLAGTIGDGQKVYVPTTGEVDSLAKSGWNALEAAQAEADRNTSDSAASDSQNALNPDQTADGGSQRVNINTADEAALTGLPGIGEAKAKSIIAYRTEHGRFSSIEEIMEISGIKEAVFSKIKDYITVD